MGGNRPENTVLWKHSSEPWWGYQCDRAVAKADRGGMEHINQVYLKFFAYLPTYQKSYN
ncbi:hypothetical protein [Sphaerospermopsis sp. FACHB-1194]|uniref:hypothetical protein n=1 Tax=Sphaerospermopsis sp. FACHB-1194 TaxID=2692862 RepID=UPI001680CDA1|nr:hypothetical protein [Sphaerospermopsis sp. FACHB-1194]MBD2148127.1 hypothetical protein [Sphaerospermopsis sp. FACHB-1194]